VDRLRTRPALALFEHGVRDARPTSPSMSAANRWPGCFAKRIFAPLGMAERARAIIGADRTLYAKAMRRLIRWRLTPAACRWPRRRGSTSPSARECVSSTADDMLPSCGRWPMRCRARGLGLSPQQARSLAAHAVPSDTAGNELRQRADARRRERAAPISTTPAGCCPSPRPSTSTSRAASARSRARPSARSPTTGRGC